MQFSNPEVLVIDRDEPTILGGNSADGVYIELDPQTVATGEAELEINFTLPDGYKINELTDSTIDFVLDDMVELEATDNQVVITDVSTTIPLTLSEGDSTIAMTIALFYCEEDSYCLIDDVQIDVPLIITEDAENNTIVVDRDVILPEFLTNND